MNIVLLRRRNLGRKTGKNIPRMSRYNIQEIKSWKMDYNTAPKADILIRWGCTARYPQNPNCTVINKTGAIHNVSDKAEFRMQLQSLNISVPQSYKFAEWLGKQQNIEILNSIPSSFFPAIARPHHHAKGKDFWEIDDKNSLGLCLHKHPDIYVQKKINIKKEYGVYFSNRIIYNVTDKTDINNIIDMSPKLMSEITGRRAVTWVEAMITAEKAVQHSDLNLCRADIAIDQDDKPYVLELNSAFSNNTRYRQQLLAEQIDNQISKILE